MREKMTGMDCCYTEEASSFLHYEVKYLTMQHTNQPKKEPIKADLKHDNMEYAASSDGDDILDSDVQVALITEEEQITANELNLLLDDNFNNQAEAFNSAETDSLVDADNFLHEEEADEESDSETDD